MRPAFDQAFQDVLALFQAGRLADAEAAAQALAAAHPGRAPAYTMLGVIQASRGHSGPAIAAFGRAIALDPGSDEAHFNLGIARCSGGDYAAAVESFRTAIRLKPGNAAAAINLGSALRELGALKDAEQSYRQAVAAGGPELARAHSNLGAVLSDLGRDDEAIAAFRRALAVTPRHADAHLNLGRVLRRQGRIGQAAASFRSAADCAPESSEAWILLADALRDLGQLEDAVAGYRKALALRADDRQALYHMGLALLDLGRHREGLDAIARGPGIARLGEAQAGDPKPRRADIASAAPTFIGCWLMEDGALCDRVVAFFESQTARHNAGRTGSGVDLAAKHSTDLSVCPADLGKPGFEAIAAYLRELDACFRDYRRQWPHLGEMLRRVDLVPFTVQRYDPGGHFQKVHSERMTFGFIHRVLAWMTYLNDVADGGATHFPHFGLQVRPERGKTLIWPAEWTHAHAGGIVTAGRKYIITGWMHFPHERG